MGLTLQYISNKTFQLQFNYKIGYVRELETTKSDSYLKVYQCPALVARLIT